MLSSKIWVSVNFNISAIIFNRRRTFFLALLNLSHLTIYKVLNCNGIRSNWTIEARSIYQFVKINCTGIDIFGYNFVYFFSNFFWGTIILAASDFGVDTFLAAFSTNFLPESIATVLPHQKLSFQYPLLQFFQLEELPTLIAFGITRNHSRIRDVPKDTSAFNNVFLFVSSFCH